MAGAKARHLQRVGDTAAGLFRQLLNFGIGVVMRHHHGVALAQGTCDELKRGIRMGERIVAELEAPLPARDLDRLRVLPHVIAADVEGEGDLLSVTCEPSDHNLTDVLAALRAAGARLGRITCAPPTLNDVFLEITGRELRD